MRDVFRLASLRGLLAVIIAAAGLSGLVASSSAQIEGDVWTSIYVESPAGPENVGVSWAIDDASVGGEEARVAEGQDFYDLPGWIIQENLAEGTYWLTLAVTGYEVIQEQFVVDESTATLGDYWYLNLSYTLTPAQEPEPQPEGYMTVIVEDEAGDIIEGAYVAFHDIAEEGIVFPNDGSFTTSQTYGPGTYGFTVSADGYASQDGSLTIVDDNVSTVVTLVAATEPSAFIHLNVSSADPSVANTLPEGSMYVVYDNSGAGRGVIAEGAFTQLDLPVTVHLEGVPFGEMLIAVDGTPVFAPYERTHDIVESEQVLDIVLDPIVPDDGDDDDNGDHDDEDKGDKDKDKKDGDKKKDKDKKKDGEKVEDVKALPAVGSGPSGPDTSGLTALMAFIAAIVTAGVGLRLRRFSA